MFGVIVLDVRKSLRPPTFFKIKNLVFDVYCFPH